MALFRADAIFNPVLPSQGTVLYIWFLQYVFFIEWPRFLCLLSQADIKCSLQNKSAVIAGNDSVIVITLWLAGSAVQRPLEGQVLKV